jgi:hypothetical protein
MRSSISDAKRAYAAQDTASGGLAFMPTAPANGFYAATKRKLQDNSGGYEPTLTATTKNVGGIFGRVWSDLQF